RLALIIGGLLGALDEVAEDGARVGGFGAGLAARQTLGTHGLPEPLLEFPEQFLHRAEHFRRLRLEAFDGCVVHATSSPALLVVSALTSGLEPVVLLSRLGAL